MNMYTNTQNIACDIREVLDHLGLPVDSSEFLWPRPSYLTAWMTVVRFDSTTWNRGTDFTF